MLYNLFTPGGSMKTRVAFCVLLFLLLTAGSSQAQSALGIFAGFNRASLSGDAPAKASYASHFGLGGGLVGEIGIAKDVRLSLQPMFLQKGTKIGYKVAGEKQPRDSLDVQLDYFSLPVLFKVVSGNHKTYVTGGLDFALLSKARLTNLNRDEGQIDIKEVFQSFDLAMNFGFGGMFPIGRPLLTFELRYQQSLLNLANPDHDPENRSLPRRFRSTGLQFYAGILLPLGKS